MWFAFIKFFDQDIEYMFDHMHNLIPFSTNDDLFRELGS
jgi:hypothetical protein